MPKQVIYSVEVGLKGRTPLILHKCGTTKPRSTNDNTDYSDEWIAGVYIGMNTTHAIIPSLNIIAMLVQAAKGHKIGRKAIKPLINPGIDIHPFEVEIRIGDNFFTIEDIRKNDWIYECPGKRGGGMVPIRRACIPIGWTLDFVVEVSDSLIEKKKLNEIFEDAGYKKGLGDQRPGSPIKPGKFGQFDIVKFE